MEILTIHLRNWTVGMRAHHVWEYRDLRKAKGIMLKNHFDQSWYHDIQSNTILHV